MSNFLQLLPRRLPVALADYVAYTGKEELQRRAIAERIYAALPTDQQAETSRIYALMSANTGHGAPEKFATHRSQPRSIGCGH